MFNSEFKFYFFNFSYKKNYSSLKVKNIENIQNNLWI